MNMEGNPHDVRPAGICIVQGKTWSLCFLYVTVHRRFLQPSNFQTVWFPPPLQLWSADMVLCCPDQQQIRSMYVCYLEPPEPFSLVSTLTQNVFVQLWNSVWIYRPWKEVSEPLMSPWPCPITRRPVFVQGHKVKGAFLSVSVDVGGVGVVPVFLKLLPEDTFCWQLRLQTESMMVSLEVKVASAERLLASRQRTIRSNIR